MRIKLTAEKVRCAKCVNCINNTFRLRMDDPKVKDLEKQGCRACYVERMREKSETMISRIETIESLCRIVGNRYSKTYLKHIDPETYNGDVWLSENMERYDILHGFFTTLKSIMDAKSVQELEEMKKQYDAEYYFREEDGK